MGKKAPIYVYHAPGGVEPEPRFEYDPKGNIFKRILVGFGVKSKLASSKLVAVPYRWWVRWILAAIIAFIAVLLTPQLLPKWLGFNWSTPSDLCERGDEKLQLLQDKIEGMAHLPEAVKFIEHAETALECMDTSVHETWTGERNRILYPDECIPSNAKAETKTERYCIPSKSKKVCVDSWGLSLFCKTVTTPEVCKEIKSTDQDSVRRIAELNAERQYHQDRLLEQSALDQDDKDEVEEVKGTADKAAEKIINRLLIQIDIASNLYLLYTVIAILIGTPVMIYKRELGSRVVTATFGMRKANFIVVIVVILTLYDSASQVIREANFPQLMANFRNDPCYLDPEFSRARLDLIGSACGNVTALNGHLDVIITNMSTLYYDATLCEVCEASGKSSFPSPALVRNLQNERQLYEAGVEKGYVYPGFCNASAIANATATPPESGVSWGKAILGSGILAQILLKGILATWMVHMVSYLEPMTMHRGMVEIYGIREEVPGKNVRLSKGEKESVYRFAKDKHIVPLMIWSLLLSWELVIIIYSAVISKNSTGDLTQIIALDNQTVVDPFDLLTCMFGKMKSISPS